VTSPEKLIDACEVNPARLRAAVGRFASGVTVVSTVLDDVVHGMTANAFTSVSLDPPLVLVSIAERAKMDGCIRSAGRYGVSILRRDQERLSLHFAGTRFRQPPTPAFTWRSGLPFVEGALAQIACSVSDSHPAGDHVLHIGRVEGLWYESGEPLVFHTGMFKALDTQEEQTWGL
jgi:flavin reductase (DIM6/NTAB) family NADH-FMN oxidoreductase RutF